VKKSIRELKELRGEALRAMTALVEQRGESMDEKSLAAVKSFKEDIANFDAQIEAIESVRSLAMKSSKPQIENEKADYDAHQKELRGSFNKFLTQQTLHKEVRAVGAGDATAGKETVPDDFMRELQKRILEYGVISPDARHITTANHGVLKIPQLDDTTSSAVWTAEHGAITPEDFATAEIEMNAFKVTTAITISTELLEDSAFNMQSEITKLFAERLGRTMEDAYLNGNGTGKPLGIIPDTGTKAITSAAPVAISISDILDMIDSLQPTSTNGAVFYASKSAISEFRGWIDADGRPLLQLSADATQADGIKMSLYGYPVKPNYSLGALLTDEVPLIFGNPKNYMIRNVRSMSIERSDEARFLNDEVVFKGTARVDGKIITNNDAFAKLVML